MNKMKIQIIGLGIVGTAQAYLSQKLKHEVMGYDVALDNHPYCTINDCIVRNVDITFICTPESVVEDVINSLVDIGHTGIIVVRSTVPIRTIERLSKKLSVHICHNPEFLREQFHLEDVLNPNMTVIGECCKEHGYLLESFYKPIDRPIIRVDNMTSELVKLAINAHLSTLITFWNEISELCSELNIDAKNVSNIICHDPRISSYGCEFFGNPYGGKCLPKDMVHLITGFREQGLNPKLFEACESFNEHLTEKTREKIKEKVLNRSTTPA
jgi:UDPglucose 6-dehydrogenase